MGWQSLHLTLWMNFFFVCSWDFTHLPIYFVMMRTLGSSIRYVHFLICHYTIYTGLILISEYIYICIYITGTSTCCGERTKCIVPFIRSRVEVCGWHTIVVGLAWLVVYPPSFNCSWYMMTMTMCAALVITWVEKKDQNSWNYHFGSATRTHVHIIVYLS